VERGRMLRIYLDNCCYNRPFDEIRNEKIKIESQAVEEIIGKFVKKEIQIFTSGAIEFELSRISEGSKKRQVEDLYDSLDLLSIPYTNNLDKRVDELEEYNIHFMDAYHIAYAESKNLDYLLTVDKKLINASKRGPLKIKVISPVEFIMEVI